MTVTVARTAFPADPAERPTGAAAHWDASVVLIVTTWLYVLVPRVAQSLLAPRNRLGVGDPVPYVPTAAAVEMGCRALLVGCCVVILFRHRNRIPTDRRLTLLVLLAPWIYLVVRDLYVDHRPGPSSLLFPLVVVTAWVVRPPLSRLALLGVTAALTATVSMTMAVLDPAKGIFVSAEGEFVAAEKEILPIGLLVGPFQGGNNLGRILMLGVPFLLLVRNRWHRALLAAPLVFALVWSSSRSSLLAVAIALAVAGLIRIVPGSRRATTGRLLMTAAVGVMVAVPLLTTDPQAFTNRGLVWSTTLRQWGDHVVFGLGSDWFARAAEYGQAAASTAYHGHNQFVHVGVTAGLVGVLVVGVLIGHLIAAAARWTGVSAAPCAFVVALVVSCTLEVSIGIVDRDSLLSSSTLAIALLLLADRRARDGAPPAVSPDR